MRELTKNEIQEVNGGILHVVVAIAAHALVRLAVKTVIRTAVGTAAAAAGYNSIRS